MELRQLEHFVAVAEEQSFTRAARRMNIAQSGLSMSIRTLERELSARLFIRAPKRVALTAAGRTLLPEARTILSDVRRAATAVADTQQVLRGTLLVGSAPALPAAFDLPTLLGTFCRRYPKVRVEVRQDSSGALLRAVRTGAVDVGFVATPSDVKPKGVKTVPVAQSTMMFACEPHHGFAKRDAIAISDLAGARFVDFNTDWAVRRITDRIFEQADVERDTAVVVNDVHLLLGCVAHGLGVAVVPEVFRCFPEQVRYIPLQSAKHNDVRLVVACANR
jgi:DNA-binding transcriptional LysR family regulator